MNILISTWSLQIGGAEIFVVNFAKELNSRGHNVCVFVESNFISQDLLSKLKINGIRVLSFHNLSFFSFITWKLNAFFSFLGYKNNFYKKVSDFYFYICTLLYRIDIISSHSAYSDNSKINWIEKSKKKIVFTDHGECAAWAAKNNFFFKDFLATVSTVVSVSKKGMQFLLLNSFVESDKLHLIYNGVLPQNPQSQINLRYDLKIDKDAFVFGMLGRDSVQKGWDIAIRAFELLLKNTTGRDVHLVLVGLSRDSLTNIDLTGIDDKVHFVEPTSNPGPYIDIMNVGLVPSCYYEGLPTVVIEFLYAGKPVIASDLGGIPEIVEFDTNCTAGILIELTNEIRPKTDALAAAMNTYLYDNDILMTHKARTKHAAKRFDMAVCVSNYENLFHKVLHK